MTDALDRLAPAAKPLLHLVDTALAEGGAATDDPVWPRLRRVRALPSDAVAAVAGWRAAPLEASAGPLRTLARRYAEALDGVPAHPPWEGAGAVAYGVQWSALRGHVIGAGPASMVGRLGESATYLEELADWVRRSRRAVAVALADVLGSAEAVTLVTDLSPAGPAAARIAAHVLDPVAAACREGHELADEWHSRLAELPLHRAPSGTSSGSSGASTVRIGE